MIGIGAAIGAGVGALTQIGTAIGQAVQGKKQRKEAEAFMEQYPRPTYEIPTSQMEALEIARSLSTMGMPGVGATQELMGESTSAGVRSLQDYAQDPAALLAATTGLYSQQQKQATQLGITDAQARLANLAGLQGALGTQAQYEDKVFQTNVMEPYLQAAAAASALTEAGLTNQRGALEGGMDVIGGLASVAGSLVDYSMAGKDDGTATFSFGALDKIIRGLGRSSTSNTISQGGMMPQNLSFQGGSSLSQFQNGGFRF